MEKPVIFKSEGQQVVGMLHLPEKGRGKVPAVVFLHGFTGNKGEFRRVFVRTARALAEIGVASLRFDFRGSGDSGGEFSAMTPSGELQDAREALHFLRKQPEVDGKRIAILGMSLGGMIAAHVLGEDRRLLTGVLWNPVAHPFERYSKSLSPAEKKQLKEMGCIDMNGWALGQAFIADMRKMNPLKAIAGARCPVLLIQGSNDQTVLPSSAADYQKAFRKSGQDMRVHMVNGAGHCFESLRWEMELIGVTLCWLRERLLP
jgi:dipeptidyl aminopeptidase/acylaminoacyl peptidase